MGTMNNRYTGMRYVPLIKGDWSAIVDYEPLTVVKGTDGNSYTSKTFVPKGIVVTNTAYWTCTGNYNAQVEAYRQEVVTLGNTVAEYVDDIAEINVELSKNAFDGFNVKYFAVNGIITSESVNNAIAYAVANNINKLVIPKGDYSFDTINMVGLSNLEIDGCGSTVTIGEGKNCFEVKYDITKNITGTASDSYFPSNGYITSTIVSTENDLCIIGSTDSATNEFSWITRVVKKDTNRMYLDGSLPLTVNAITIINMRGRTKNITLSNFNFKGGRIGINVTQGENVTIKNCYFEGQTDSGFTFVQCYNCITTGCQFDMAGTFGLHLFACTRCEIYGNNIKASNTSYSFMIRAVRCISCVIDNNICYRERYTPDGATSIDGIIIDSEDTRASFFNRITNNSVTFGGVGFAGNGRGGIMLLKSTSFCFVDGNKCYGNDFGIYISTAA
jgi:parallel beta-helix repeat protein